MRLIARLDIKPPNVIKPIYYDGLRVIGDPVTMAKEYGLVADEIVYIDTVASLYQRDICHELIQKVSKDLYIPFLVGGGIKNIYDAKKIINNAADKIILNTQAINRPQLIKELQTEFGSSACVLHIQAKRWINSYECYIECGRNRTHKDIFEWAKEAEDLGIGEILLSVIDNDGAKSGFDLQAAEKMISSVNVPVIIGSGAGNLEHILEVAQLNPSGIALGSILHQGNITITDVKKYLEENGVNLN